MEKKTSAVATTGIVLFLQSRKRKGKVPGVGFEPTPPFGDQNARSHYVVRGYDNLKSGALDHSAILTSLTDVASLGASIIL